LTVVDGYSRYLLACQGLCSTAIHLARPVFKRLFEEYGLPRIIRTDNGVPFATTALGRLSTLSVWWIRLGIRPELIEPAHPEHNGRHERMHRTPADRRPQRTLGQNTIVTYVPGLKCYLSPRPLMACRPRMTASD
jgi:transposase InsO family protein